MSISNKKKAKLKKEQTPIKGKIFDKRFYVIMASMYVLGALAGLIYILIWK